MNVKGSMVSERPPMESIMEDSYCDGDANELIDFVEEVRSRKRSRSLVFMIDYLQAREQELRHAKNARRNRVRNGAKQQQAN